MDTAELPKEEFELTRVAGMTIGATTEGLASDQQAHWCRLDNVSLVKLAGDSEVPADPENPADPEYTHIQDLFLDSFGECGAWYVTSSAADVSTPPADLANENAKQGAYVQRFKLDSRAEGVKYQWVKVLHNPITGLDPEKDALQFWFNPLVAAQDLQVGITCEAAGKHPTLRISLNEYLNLQPEDYGDWKWKKVVIPLSEFEMNGTMYYEEKGEPTAEYDSSKFSWNRIDGMTIGATTEAFPTQASWCRLDEICFVRTTEQDDKPVTEPTVVQDLFLDAYPSGIWTLSSGVEGVSTPVDSGANAPDAPQGNAWQRLKVKQGYGNGYEWLKMVMGSPLDMRGKEDTAALEFWYNPESVPADVQVGLLCEAGGKYPALRLSFSDELVVKEAVFGARTWKKVSIPFSALLENGKCFDEEYDKATNTVTRNEISADQFNWGRIAGMTIGATTESFTDWNVFCRLDEVRIVDYPAAEDDKQPEKKPEVHYNAEVLDPLYQTITGWGVYPSNQEIAVFGDKTAVHKALFEEMGITRFRQELRGSVVDDSGNFTDLMDSLAAKLKIGVFDYGVTEYTLNIWSPPSSMKTNQDYSTGHNADGSVARLLEDKEQDFCDYIVKCLDHLTKEEKLPAPIAMSLQNEPSTATAYQSCWYDKVQYKRVAIMLRHTLDAAGYDGVKLMGPESDEYKNSVVWMGEGFSELLNDPEYNDAIDVLASHSYKGKDATDQNIIDWAQNVAKFPEKEAWMTEYCTAGNQMGDLEIDRAIEAMRILTSDLAWGGINSWFWWLGWDPRYSAKNPYQEVILEGEGKTDLYKGTTYQVLAQLFNSVPVNSHVQRMSTDDPTAANKAALLSDLVAFNTGSGTVCMITNTSRVAKAYDISGLKGQSVSVYTTSEVNQSVKNTDSINIIGETAKDVFVPARSIVIVTTDAADHAAPAVSVDENPQLFEENGSYTSRDQILHLSGSVDEQASVTVNGREVALGADFTFTADITLTEGGNIITIEAKDVNGNRSVKKLNVKYDPSYLALVMEKTADRVNNTGYTLKGRVNVPAEVTVNGTVVEVKDDLTFEHQVTLNQGVNTFEVAAVSTEGTKTVTVKVSCDSVAPVITVNQQGGTVTDSEYVITGSVSETLAGFRVDGEDVSVSLDDTFITKVSLKEGKNEIKLTGTDPYKNEGTTVLTITYNRTETSPLLPDPDNAVAYAVRTDNKVTVDGDISEADWAISQKAAKPLSGTPNNIFNFGTMWDDDYLYVAAVVQDEALCFGDEKNRQYMQDCFELFLNPTNSKAGAYSGKDMQLFAGWDKDRQNAFDNGKGILTGWKDLEDGYSVEMAIPWASLDITDPAADLAIGFDVANDDSDIYGSRQHIIGWAGTGDNWQDTSKFGTLILSVKKDQGTDNRPDLETDSDPGSSNSGSDSGSSGSTGAKDPVSPAPSADTPNPPAPDNLAAASPNAGDHTPISIFAALLFLSGALAIALIRASKAKRI